MPRRCPIDSGLDRLITAQDHVVSRQQLLDHGMTRSALSNRKKYDGWRELASGVYLCHPGEPARRQMLVAALLFAGPAAAIDDVDACHYYGIKSVTVDDALVHVAVPADSPARSRGFVVVRRTAAPFTVTRTQLLRYIHPADAVIAASRHRTSDRAVLALLSDAVQRGVTTHEELMRGHVQGPPRNARAADLALAEIGAGIRSAPEAAFRALAAASVVLPPLLYNRRLRLPGGEVVCPDALALDAGLVHETNGRSAHRRHDLFEDMQVRHDLMTETGLTVMHNSPGRLWRHGREVISQFERTYLRLSGRGLPPGVVLLDA